MNISDETVEAQPSPCEYCSRWAGDMRAHDGSCDGITGAQIELRELMMRANATASPATSLSIEDHYARAILHSTVLAEAGATALEEAANEVAFWNKAGADDAITQQETINWLRARADKMRAVK